LKKYKFLEKEHIHTFDNKPLMGTSTIVSSIGKGAALSWWASQKACEVMGWIKPVKDEKNNWCILNGSDREISAMQAVENIKNMSPAEYLALLDIAYKAHSTNLKKTAKSGTDLHAELESYIKSQMKGQKADYSERLESFVEWSKKNVKEWLFSEIHVYSESMGTGGIIDCGFIDKDDYFVIGDFKSGGAWFSGMAQIGGYDIQLFENMAGHDADGNKIFEPIKYQKGTKHAILSFKDGFKKPFVRADIESNKNAFKFAHGLYVEQMKFEKEVSNGKS
jgi:hypothetical protein